MLEKGKYYQKAARTKHWSLSMHHHWSLSMHHILHLNHQTWYICSTTVLTPIVRLCMCGHLNERQTEGGVCGKLSFGIFLPHITDLQHQGNSKLLNVFSFGVHFDLCHMLGTSDLLFKKNNSSLGQVFVFWGYALQVLILQQSHTQYFKKSY